MNVSVIIPVLNAEALIGHQLNALNNQADAPDFELVVVDNGSTDDTSAVLRRFAASSPRMVVTCVFEPRRGINLARNAGIERASSPLVAVCDADDIVDSHWLRNLTESLRPGQFAGGRVLPFGEGSVADHASARTTFSFGANHLESPFGGNCAFFKDDWKQVGGFDARLSGPGDEAEFFARMVSAGKELKVRDDALVHYRLGSAGAATPRRIFSWAVHRSRTEALATKAGSGGPVRPQTLRSIGWLVLHLFDVLAVDRRTRWVGSAARTAGHLWGWACYGLMRRRPFPDVAKS